MKILFQGDSITHAFRQESEQNPAFQLGNGYVFLIASHLHARHPGAGLQFYNRGICGEGVGQLLARWQEDALDLAPDYLSLLIGVNDTVNAMLGNKCPTDEEFHRLYAMLLSRFTSRFPSSKIILLEPFLLEVGSVTSAWRNHLRSRQTFVREFAARSNFRFIPLQQIFEAALSHAPDAHWTWDGIHPTHAGFQLIADAWLNASADLLPEEVHSKLGPIVPSAPISVEAAGPMASNPR